MKLYKDISQLVTLAGVHKKDGRKLFPADLSVIHNGAIAFDDSKILWVGTNSDIPENFKNADTHSLMGKTLTPELVDCHTHLVFGGDRSQEYCDRLNGKDYQLIAKEGGGILSTMTETRASSTEALIKTAKERIERIYSFGVGTIEIKSGYGLSIEKEYELSHIIYELKNAYKDKIQILNTYMAAHAVPKEYTSPTQYMEEVVYPLLERLAPEKILDAVDIFHEDGYFGFEETEKFFQLAHKLGLPVKSHADEFKDNRGAALAVKYKALSTDHLLRTSDTGIKALAESDTVATLLPGTGFFLGKPQSAARKMCDAGVKVAIASDYNPGSCHCDNVLLIAAISAPTLKLNMTETWAAITYNAAHALGLKHQGALIPGMSPRFTLFDTDALEKVTYHWGKNFNLSQ